MRNAMRPVLATLPVDCVFAKGKVRLRGEAQALSRASIKSVIGTCATALYGASGAVLRRIAPPPPAWEDGRATAAFKRRC